MKNEILKETLLHYINLEYYANEIDEEFQILLEELEDRCETALSSMETLNTKSAYSAIMRVIKDEVGNFEKNLEERLEEEAQFIMDQELIFLDETYNSRGGINGTLLALSAIPLSRLLFAPVVGNDSLKQFSERTGKNITQSYDKVMRSGYLFGQNTNDLINNTKNSLKQVSRGMQNGIRTIIPAFAKTADRIVFLNNNVEVVWVTTLDGSTCLTCSSLSGLHFKSIADAPGTPHPLCRCQLIAAGKVEEPIPDFEEFIDELDEEEQKHVLGENRFQLWKDYHIQLKNFLNNGTTIRLDELKAKYARLIENKNLIMPEAKLAGYALNPKHTSGKHKAEVFKSALGYTVDNWRDLEENIRNHLNQKNMVVTKTTEFGTNYRNDIEITGPNGNTKVVRTAWLKKADSDEYNLITIYVR